MTAGPASLGWYLARRLLQAAPLVLGVLMITFTLIHLAPGDPIYLLAGEGGGYITGQVIHVNGGLYM